MGCSSNSFFFSFTRNTLDYVIFRGAHGTIVNEMWARAVLHLIPVWSDHGLSHSHAEQYCEVAEDWNPNGLRVQLESSPKQLLWTILIAILIQWAWCGQYLILVQWAWCGQYLLSLQYVDWRLRNLWYISMRLRNSIHLLFNRRMLSSVRGSVRLVHNFCCPGLGPVISPFSLWPSLSNIPLVIMLDVVRLSYVRCCWIKITACFTIVSCFQIYHFFPAFVPRGTCFVILFVYDMTIGKGVRHRPVLDWVSSENVELASVVSSLVSFVSWECLSLHLRFFMQVPLSRVCIGIAWMGEGRDGLVGWQMWC